MRSVVGRSNALMRLALLLFLSASTCGAPLRGPSLEPRLRRVREVAVEWSHEPAAPFDGFEGFDADYSTGSAQSDSAVGPAPVDSDDRGEPRPRRREALWQRFARALLDMVAAATPPSLPSPVVDEPAVEADDSVRTRLLRKLHRVLPALRWARAHVVKPTLRPLVQVLTWKAPVGPVAILLTCEPSIFKPPKINDQSINQSMNK